ncbi:MAG: endolytic transglycosylase MltG [Dehalococcoidia bacterium]
MRFLPILALATSIGVALVGFVILRQIPAYAIGKPPISTGAAQPPGTETVSLEVRDGDTAQTIAHRLKDAGIIQNGELFTELTSLEGLQNGLAAGQYDFSRNTPTADVIARLRQGNPPALKVTIPEGKRIEEVADLLQKSGVISGQDFLNALKDGHYSYDFLADGAAGPGLEGYIFPDTYNFPKKNKPEDVVNAMLKDFDRRLTPDLRQAYKQENLSLQQALTLASIVEREAQVPSERPTIASVFFNRLQQRMPLQTDPTVQFALAADPKSVAEFGWWKRDVTLDDLKIKSPYNTYLNNGLPPGPIANPGLASLQAVAHPAQTRFLFFVAKNDGSHVFAETFAEHQANIAKYQR